MRLELIVIWLLLIVAGCSNTTGNHLSENKEGFTYLALGDSYTIGESVDKDLRYPVQLADSLKKMGIELSKVKIVAETGWTTNDLLKGIDSVELDEEYSIVSLLIGVNNQYQNRSISEYKVEFEELLQTAIKFAGGDPQRVFVISIPDYGYTPFGENKKASISRDIDEFNDVNKNISKNLKVDYFNITPISRKAPENPGLVASDGLHPSGLMYGQWVSLIKNDVKNILLNSNK